MEIAAIIAGILAVLTGLLPGLSRTQRGMAILGGAGFAIYGIYVLNQTSGTWEFPIYLYLLPLFIIGAAGTASQHRKPE